MRRRGLIRLGYRPEELQYLISSDDVKEMLADYASSHSILRKCRKELEGLSQGRQSRKAIAKDCRYCFGTMFISGYFLIFHSPLKRLGSLATAW